MIRHRLVQNNNKKKVLFIPNTGEKWSFNSNIIKFDTKLNITIECVVCDVWCVCKMCASTQHGITNHQNTFKVSIDREKKDLIFPTKHIYELNETHDSTSELYRRINLDVCFSLLLLLLLRWQASIWHFISHTPKYHQINWSTHTQTHTHTFNVFFPILLLR